MPALEITLQVKPVSDRPAIYQFSRGGFGPDNDINFTIQDSAGQVYDLTGKTASLILLDRITKHGIFEKDLDIVSPGGGTAKYEPKEGDFSFLNIYYLLVRIKDSANEEYTERPVLFIDVPLKVKNKNFRDLGIIPFELTLRTQIGIVLSPGELDSINQNIEQLITEKESYRLRIRAARQQSVFVFGESSKIGAKFICEYLKKSA